MATTIVMPQMGYDMREGTVVRWRKQEGEAVSRGEVIAEIETDKATVEMEAYSGGILSKIVVEEGKTVPVGELIAVIGEPGETLPPIEELQGKEDVPTAAPTEQAVAESKAEAATTAPAPAKPAPSTEKRATPIARRLAREKGIDLTTVSGTGPGGRITEADIVSYEKSGGEAPAPPTAAPAAPQVLSGGKVELSRMRRAIAKVTVQSKREAPHFYVTSEIDMSEAMSVRAQLNETLGGDIRVSVNDLIVKATALALVTYPNFNASFQEDHLQLHANLNIGIAIALEQGLIVPAVSDCQNKSLAEIAKASRDLIQRAQNGTLRAEEYTGGTLSISNLGMFDVESFAAIIFPPNAAVLAVGTVKEQPVVRDGQIVIAQTMKATVSVDHRVADGAEGARFLMEVKKNLEQPVRLLL